MPSAPLRCASAVADGALFVADGDALVPTSFAVGPWSADTLQASAYGGLLVRALERAPAPAGMMIARLSFDLWRPVTREPLTTSVSVLREGRKAQTLEASLVQAGKPVGVPSSPVWRRASSTPT